MKRAIKTRVLRENQKIPGIKARKLTGASQPPKKRIVFNDDIKIMFAYSPKEKSAKPIAEYSTL